VRTEERAVVPAHGRGEVQGNRAAALTHISITLDTYSHAIPAMQDEAAALIAGLVFAAK
jgi:hypothetical protein